MSTGSVPLSALPARTRGLDLNINLPGSDGGVAPLAIPDFGSNGLLVTPAASNTKDEAPVISADGDVPRRMSFTVVSQTVRVNVEKPVRSRCGGKSTVSLVDCCASFVVKLGRSGAGRSGQTSPSTVGYEHDSDSDDGDGGDHQGNSRRAFFFHFRQGRVVTVRVNGSRASFHHARFLGPQVARAPRLDAYTANLMQDVEASREGELIVGVPSGSSCLIGDEMEIDVEYELRQPAGVVHSWTGGEQQDTWCVYTRADSLSGTCGARCWFPCAEEQAAPTRLEISIPPGKGVVALSGAPFDPARSSCGQKVFFVYDKPIYPRNVGFVVGTLDAVDDSVLPWVKHYYVRNRNRGMAVKKATSQFSVTVKKCKELLGQTERPVSKYVQVFIPGDAVYEPLCVSLGLSVISDQFLKSLDEEKGEHASALTQAVGYAHCYFGCGIVTTRRLCESWLVHGLAAFLANAAMRSRDGRASLIRDGYTTLKHLDGIVATEARRLALDAAVGFTLCGGPLRPPPVESAPMDNALSALGGLDLVDVLAHGEGGDVTRLRIFFQGIERRWGSQSFWQALQYILQSCEPVEAESGMKKLPVLRRFSSGSSLGSDSPFSPVTPAAITPASGNTSPRSDVSDEQPSPVPIDSTLRGGRARSGSFMSTTSSQEDEKYVKFEPGKGIGEESFFSTLKCFPPSSDEYAKDHESIKQWLTTCAGLAHLQCGAVYDSKNNKVEVILKQRVPDGGNMYAGPIQIRVVEIGGTWHYMKRVEGRSHAFTFDLHSAPSKKRKTSAMYSGTKTSVDTTCPLKYIVVDPQTVWVASITLRQSESSLFKAVSLQDGEDDIKEISNGVVRRIHSLRALSSIYKKRTSLECVRCARLLFDVLMNGAQHPFVRAEAASQLLRWHEHYAVATKRVAIAREDDKLLESSHGYKFLLKAYDDLFRSKAPPPKDPPYPLWALAVRPAVVAAIAKTRDVRGLPYGVSCDVMLHTLDTSSGSGDSEVVSKVIEAAGGVIASLSFASKDSELSKYVSASPKDADEKSLRLCDYLERLIHVVRLRLDFDVVCPSASRLVTRACLRALAAADIHAMGKSNTPFAVYALGGSALSRMPDLPRWSNSNDNRMGAFMRRGAAAPESSLAKSVSWGASVRCAAYYSIIDINIRHGMLKGDDDCSVWMRCVAWVLRSSFHDPSPLVSRRVLNSLLDVHASTLDEGADSSAKRAAAGVFWPLAEAASDLTSKEREAAHDVIEVMWMLLNRGSEYDARLRCAAYQLWRCIWGDKMPEILTGQGHDDAFDDIAPFANWAGMSEEYWSRFQAMDEDTYSPNHDDHRFLMGIRSDQDPIAEESVEASSSSTKVGPIKIRVRTKS